MITPKRYLLFLIKILSKWTTPIETKHFIITDNKVIEFAEVHTPVRTVDTMDVYPDKYTSLKATGHKHYGYDSYYPQS